MPAKNLRKYQIKQVVDDNQLYVMVLYLFIFQQMSFPSIQSTVTAALTPPKQQKQKLPTIHLLRYWRMVTSGNVVCVVFQLKQLLLI